MNPTDSHALLRSSFLLISSNAVTSRCTSCRHSLACPTIHIARGTEPGGARRRQDPLGEGQPATWRLLLIKVAASVIVRCRRIVVRLSGSWPHRELFEQIGQHVSSRPPGPACWTG